MQFRVVTTLGYEVSEADGVAHLVKDGKHLTLPDTGEGLQEIVDALVMCSQSLSSRRMRAAKFRKEADHTS